MAGSFTRKIFARKPRSRWTGLPAERHSIIPIACLRLSRMRLKATESAVISTDGVMDESVVTGRPGQ